MAEISKNRQIANYASEHVSVKDFGAVGDGVTDDTAAIQAALDYVVAGGDSTPKKIFFGSKHLITNSLDFSEVGGDRFEVIGGDTLASTEIIVDYNGYGSGAIYGPAFNFGNVDSPAYQTAVSINGFLFNNGANSTRQPIGISGASLAQSRINNITFGGWNNTAISLDTPQNCRGSHITTFGGGLSFEYKDASTITVTQSGTTLTSSGAIFSASDVGKTVAIWGTGGSTYRRKAKISAYLTTTTVTVVENVTDAVARDLHFGSPFASMTASDATLTSDASCFTADHVGLVIWIKGAGTNGGLLRSKIASYTSATSVELADLAVTTTTVAEFGVAAFEIFTGSWASNGGSDNRFDGLQIEDHNGIGICLYDNDILHLDGKIHSEQSISTASDYSISTIWADRWAGSFNGDWDAQYLGEDRAWFGNQTSTLHIPTLHTRTAYGETIIRIGARNASFEGATVVLGSVSVSGDLSTDNIRGNFFKDANSPIDGYTITGAVNRSAFDLSRIFMSRDVFCDRDGNVSMNSVSFDGGGNDLDAYVRNIEFTPEVADASSGGNVAAGTLTGSYERVGNLVALSLDLRSINTAGMTAGNNLYLRGLPLAINGDINSRWVATVRMDNVTFTGQVTGYADNGDTFLLLYNSTSGGASTPLKVSALTSGTANIYLSLVYIANNI